MVYYYIKLHINTLFIFTVNVELLKMYLWQWLNEYCHFVVLQFLFVAIIYHVLKQQDCLD